MKASKNLLERWRPRPSVAYMNESAEKHLLLPAMTLLQLPDAHLLFVPPTVNIKTIYVY